MGKAREAQAICSQAHPEHENRAPASDGVLTISRRRRRLSEITIGLVCKETKRRSYQQFPLAHSLLLLPPPDLRPQLPSSVWASISFLQYVWPARAGTNTQGTPGRSCEKKGAAETGAGSPSSPNSIDGASLAWDLAAALFCLAGLGLASARRVPFHQGGDANRIVITSHARTHLGTDSPSHLG